MESLDKSEQKENKTLKGGTSHRPIYWKTQFLARSHLNYRVVFRLLTTIQTAKSVHPLVANLARRLDVDSMCVCVWVY